MCRMKKGILASVMAMVLSLLMITPAFAAELNSNEEALYDEFCSTVDKYKSALDDNTNYPVSSHYKSQAKSALAKVDLDAGACNEFSGVIKDVDKLLNGSTTRAQLKAKLPDALSKVNAVANKYGMNVSVGSHGYVTITIEGSDNNGVKKGTSTTVADSSKVTKQTGFGLAQTAVVAGAATAVLAGAVVFARKNQLFN